MIKGELAQGYEDKLHEECGVAGVFFKNPGFSDAGIVVVDGIYSLQHRGQEAAGITVAVGEDLRTMKDSGLVSQVFPDTIRIKALGEARRAIGHTRYGTVSAGDAYEAAQPHTYIGRYDHNLAVVHNGEITNTQQICEDMKWDRSLFATDSAVATHLFGHYLEQYEDLTNAGIATARDLEGAFSIVAMDNNEMVAFRDTNGIRPLVVGELGENANEGYAFASETPSIEAMGATVLREVGAGEIVTLSAMGEIRSEQYGKPDPAQCAFEYIYFARPDGELGGVELHRVREKMGMKLAEKNPVEADVVIGAPDSGIPAAIGYALQSGIPYELGLIKDRYTSRTFIQATKADQEAAARRKYHPVKSVLKDKRVVLVDDSVVNGTTMIHLARILKEAGVREVHLRITSPPIKWSCFYGVATSDQSRLIAAKVDQKELAQHLGVESISYLTEEETIECIGKEVGGLCLACFNGNYPTPVRDSIAAVKVSSRKS